MDVAPHRLPPDLDGGSDRSLSPPGHFAADGRHYLLAVHQRIARHPE